MIASRPERRALAALAALAAAFGLAACGSAAGPPAGSPLEPLAARAPTVPDDMDFAAHDVAAAALAGDRTGLRTTLRRLKQLEGERRQEGYGPSGLVPFALNLRNAGLDDDARDRRATEKLLDRDDLDPALRASLGDLLADDPLEIADARIRDARTISFAAVFNNLAEPASHAMSNMPMAAVGVARALIGVAVAEHLADELSVPERQALVQWKRFVAAHPESPRAPEIEDRIESAQAAWQRTQRDRALRGARRALQQEQPALALAAAEQALAYAPEDGEATRIRREAAASLAEARAERRRSLGADAGERAAPPEARGLAVALLLPDGDVAGQANRLLTLWPDGPLGDEARYALALAQEESGHEEESWGTLRKLADADPARSNMARHASALVDSPDQNPWDAFTAARNLDRGARLGWIVLGPLSSGPRDLDLPRPLEWLIQAPSYLDALSGIPNRLMRYPWITPWPFGRAPATYARRYLERDPKGPHAEEARSWLEDFEATRGNWAAALELAEQAPRPDPAHLADLREKTASQILEIGKAERRGDVRGALVRRVAREFPDTAAGREAGDFARRDAERETPQRIRMSRQFLRENPRLAGPDGLGLRPELLDGDLRNGELHPSGVTLAGGRVIELDFVAEHGGESAEPVRRFERVSNERLARLVSLLEETTTRNALVDPDDQVMPDADRDRFFERARLGLADEPTPRAAAQSTYAFRGMRERYGLVRSRESILPVELVLQGSLPDLGLGAFPRIRLPKPTPDAILYR